MADWERIARNLLACEKRNIRNAQPEIRGITIHWQLDTYLAGVQEIVPEYSTEIVYLQKSGDALPDELIDEINKLHPERLELYADDSLDLKGAEHVLRRVGSVLTFLTPEQSKYFTTYKKIREDAKTTIQ